MNCNAANGFLLNSTHLPEVERESFKKIGDRICQATSTFYFSACVMQRVCNETARSPGRVATMLTTGAIGLNSILNGEVISGGLCTAVALKEAINIFGTKNNKSEVARLINDARAGIDMIETLEEENKKSFQIIDFNLELVSENVEKLTSQLKEVESLAVQNCEALETQKAVVSKLYKEANDLFTEAQAKLQTSQRTIFDSHQEFKSVIDNLGVLIDSAQSIDENFEEGLSNFVKSAKGIHKQSKRASQILEEANPIFNEGLELLKQAMAKKDEASFEAGKAMQLAKDQSEKMAKTAAVEKDYQKEIKTIKNEVQEIKERNELIEETLSEAAECLEEAQRLEEASWGWTSTIIGGGIGALAGNAVLGVPGTFVGIAAGGKLFHEREKISNFVMGKDPVPVPAAPTFNNPISWEFNAKSTGLWGRYIKKRQSYTAGQMTIQLGNGETVSYPFNLNDVSKKHSPICKKDFADLGKRLAAQLKEGKISEEFCRKILTCLETVSIDRGGYHQRAQGFLRKGTPSSKFLWNTIKIKPEVIPQSA